MMNALNLEKFQSVDANPGATLQKFHDYTEQIKLLFQLTFRKSDDTALEPPDSDKIVVAQREQGHEKSI